MSASTTAFVDPYLEHLGVGFRRPDLEHLHAITRAHLSRVPFENLTKLQDWSRFRRTGELPLPDPQRTLDRMRRTGAGDTCHGLVWTLRQLLERLGYDVAVAAGHMPPVRFDHAVLLVRLAGVTWLVDIGYGAPLHEPLELDRHEISIDRGYARYRLRPTAAGHVLEQEDKGTWHFGYELDIGPYDLDAFLGSIRHSFTRLERQFLCHLHATRSEPAQAFRLRDRLVRREDHLGRRTDRETRDPDELAATVEAALGIDSAYTLEAMRVLSAERGIKLFD